MLVWGKAQLSAADRSSVKRLSDVVSSLLDHIRFPHMTSKEQAEAVQSGCVISVCEEREGESRRLLFTHPPPFFVQCSAAQAGE